MSFPIPPHESERIAALHAYQILDTAPEGVYDDLTLLAAQLCGTPMAAISLSDVHRQWFKAQVGLAVKEMPRDISFCAHAILEPELLIIPDTTQDPRVAQSPLVTGEAHLRFYAGAPLLLPSGMALGTLCVADSQPRTLTLLQQEQLQILAQQAVALIELRLTERRLKEAQRLARMGSWEENLDTGERHWSEGLFHLLDFPLEGGEPERAAVIARIHPEDRERALNDFRAIVQTHGLGTVDLRFYHQDGTLRWLHFRGKSLKDATGRTTKLVGTTMDITERKESEESLLMTRQRLDLALERARLGAFHRDIHTGDYLHTTPTWRSHFGLPADVPARYEDFLERLHPEDRDRIAALVERAFHEHTGYDTEYRCLWPDGSLHWIRVSAVPLYDSQGKVSYLSGITQDITELKAIDAKREGALHEAQERADRDPLTNLLNHRAFHKRLHEETERAQREDTHLALVMLDTDNFKFFNDVYGHATGDQVLRRIAQTLQQACRPDDTIARFGGDEFALILTSKTPLTAQELEQCLQPLRSLTYQPEGETNAIPITLSLGMAFFPQQTSDRAALIPLADEQLRRAKTGAQRETEADLTRAKMSQSLEGFSMLDALVAAVDNKDRYTKRHSEDVLRYSVQIAQVLGLNEATQQTIMVAALLHDVGKIGIPDAVLRKPGKLTEAEYAAIQQHAAMGAAIVGAVPQLADTLPAVRHHHERWDGNGYPDGLAGEAIPFLGRLLAVADAFSAMTTDRPYRKGLPAERALAILAEGAGTQWDPRLVEAFLRAARGGDQGGMPNTDSHEADRRYPSLDRHRAAA